MPSLSRPLVPSPRPALLPERRGPRRAPALSLVPPPAPPRPDWLPAAVVEAVWLGLGLHEGELRGTELLTVGAGALVDRAPELLGAPLGRLSWGPGLPCHAGRPRRLEGLVGAEEVELVDGVVVDGDRVAGWLALRVARGSARRAWSRAVRQRGAGTAVPAPQDGAVLLYRDGSVAWSTPSARRWLARSGRRERVLELVARGPGQSLWLDGACIAAEWGRAEGEPMVLVRVRPAAPVPLPKVAALTPTQYEIANFAAHAATAAEIAATLGRSAQTVRSHLKNIYQRLDVANRLELSGCFGAWGAST